MRTTAMMSVVWATLIFSGGCGGNEAQTGTQPERVATPVAAPNTLGSPAATTDPVTGPVKLAFVHTANVMGELEPCG